MRLPRNYGLNIPHYTASARKSQGEYKPVAKYPCGKTEVLQQSDEQTYTTAAYDQNRRIYNACARGTTYATRAEAIAAASAIIAERIAFDLANAHKNLSIIEGLTNPTPQQLRSIQSIKDQIEYWENQAALNRKDTP
jgi:hypothetical protein